MKQEISFEDKLIELWYQFTSDYPKENPNYRDTDFTFENFIEHLLWSKGIKSKKLDANKET